MKRLVVSLKNIIIRCEDTRDFSYERNRTGIQRRSMNISFFLPVVPIPASPFHLFCDCVIPAGGGAAPANQSRLSLVPPPRNLKRSWKHNWSKLMISVVSYWQNTRGTNCSQKTHTWSLLLLLVFCMYIQYAIQVIFRGKFLRITLFGQKRQTEINLSVLHNIFLWSGNSSYHLPNRAYPRAYGANATSGPDRQ